MKLPPSFAGRFLYNILHADLFIMRTLDQPSLHHQILNSAPKVCVSTIFQVARKYVLYFTFFGDILETFHNLYSVMIYDNVVLHIYMKLTLADTYYSTRPPFAWEVVHCTPSQQGPTQISPRIQRTTSHALPVKRKQKCLWPSSSKELKNRSCLDVEHIPVRPIVGILRVPPAPLFTKAWT